MNPTQRLPISHEEEIEADWGMTLKIWWAMTWRSVVFTLFPTVVLAIPLSITLLILQRMFGINPMIRTLLLQSLGWTIGLLAGIVVVKIILNMPFAGFRICLLKTSPQTPEASPARHPAAPESGEPVCGSVI
ncbi:MAG TPA: hypothetical protein V6C52_06340 [Coleofasciculaceae cyanobacterium]|jgi:hypothetical protein